MNIFIALGLAFFGYGVIQESAKRKTKQPAPEQKQVNLPAAQEQKQVDPVAPTKQILNDDPEPTKE